ncbi:MAG: SigB/SigF/SigG family RNA polymerase sigma factor [Clostridium sp.]|nr:SigB/SigF/SigG family RNA polymerase sigma factor [Clostridium sp.]
MVQNIRETHNNIKNHEDLFKVYAETKDIEIRNEIVSNFLYISEIISKKFLNRGIDYEDIYQVASLALIKAVERFDPERGIKFTSFATPTIVGEIKRFFRDKASVIRIPRRIYELYQKVNHAREHLAQNLQRPPRIDEVAEHLGISEERVIEIIESSNIHKAQSLDKNAFADDGSLLHETVGQEDKTFEEIENKDFLRKSIDRFNDAEKDFIHMRYFENKTQKDIALQFGVSQMYVSRLEKKVLKKFRTMLPQ